MQSRFPAHPADLGMIHATRSECGEYLLFYHPAAFVAGRWTPSDDCSGPHHFFMFRADSIPELDRLGDFEAWAPHHLIHVGPKE